MLDHLWVFFQWWMLALSVLTAVLWGNSIAIGVFAGKPGRPLAEAFVALNRGFLVFVAFFGSYAAFNLFVANGIILWVLTVSGFFTLVALLLKVLGGYTNFDYSASRLLREVAFTIVGLVVLSVIATK